MQSTLTPQDADPHDTFVIEPDVVLAARVDQAPLDPVQEILSQHAHRVAYTDSEISAGASTPAVDTTFRASAADSVAGIRGERPMAPWVKRALFAFLFAFCSAVAAEAWKHSDATRQTISAWVPPFVLAWSPTAEKPAPAEPPEATQAAAADQTPTQPASAEQPSNAPAPAVAAASPAESAPPSQTPSVQSPSVQSVAHDVAAMGQEIAQLKATIEQLRAGQAQMSHDLAKASMPSQHPKVATLPPRPVLAPPVRKPRPAYTPPSAAMASTLPPLPPAAPAALTPPPVSPMLSQPAPLPQTTRQPDGEPVVRPPMPLQ
jgi:hypothetical protein